MTTLYGIPNCDTVRKTRKWLAAHDIDYTFHDVRKDGLSENKLKSWIKAVGWETLLNKRGQTWRKLAEADKAGLDQAKAIRLMLAEPTLIKRPVLEQAGRVLVGFDEQQYSKILG
jgi:arsenate reductase